MSGPRGLPFCGHTAGSTVIIDSRPGQELSQPFSSPEEVGSAEAGNGYGALWRERGDSSTTTSQTV